MHQLCYLKGSLSFNSAFYSVICSSDYIIIYFYMLDARVPIIAYTAQGLVVEPSSYKLYFTSLAADYPLLDFPAIHPIYSGLGTLLHSLKCFYYL